MQNADERIRDLEMAIAALPAGYISKKTIKGKIKKYHQWTEGGKKKSKYLDEKSAAEMETLIGERRKLQQELRTLKNSLPKSEKKNVSRTNIFKTNVLIGEALKRYVDPIGTIKRKAVIYRGKDYQDGDIEYLNVEQYLKGLAGGAYGW